MNQDAGASGQKLGGEGQGPAPRSRKGDLFNRNHRGGPGTDNHHPISQEQSFFDIVGDEERWRDCLEVEARVIAEDQLALNLYRDHRLPLDLTTEVHVRSDKLSIAYRRLLADFVRREPTGSFGAAAG